MKQYSSIQIKAVTDMKAAFPKLSVRGLAKIADIPKSVVGRWLKEPEISKQKAEVREVRKQIKNPDRKKAFDKMVEKVIKNSKGNQKYLKIRKSGTDDEWEVVS